MISADVIAELKTKTNLVDLFSQYCHTPKKKGKNQVVKCPFHADTEASLVINPKTNLWHCFGCNEGGDAVSLIMKLDQLTFPEAAKKLAKLNGLPDEKLIVKAEPSAIKKPKPAQPKAKATTQQNHDLLDRVAAFYHRVFLENKDAQSYLKSRGLTDETIWPEYRLGYADGSLKDSFPKGSDIEIQLKEMGVLLDNGQERFLHCVVFPILDENGKCVSLYGRHTQMPTGGHFYLPGERTGIFNHQRLKSQQLKEKIIITESVIDSLTFITKGLANVMPIWGTNGFTQSHRDFLTELKPTDIILALDGDEAGKTAANRLKIELSQYTCQIATFPDSQDANDYFKTHSVQDFFLLTADPVSGSEPEPIANPELRPEPQQSASPEPITQTPVFQYQLKHVELKNGKLTVTIHAENLTTKRFLLDTFNLYSQRQRESLTDQIMALFNLKKDVAESEVNTLLKQAEIKAKNPDSQTQDDPETSAAEAITETEKAEALAFLKSPDLLTQIVTDYESIGYIGESINKQAAYLVMTSRKMANPLSLVIMSNSAAGKSSLQKATLEFCPETEAKHFTRLTQQSLYYLGEDTLKHKFLSIEEEEGSSEASYSLKVLLSAKSLNVVTTTQDPNTGKKRAEEYRTEGPVAVMVSTTSPELEAELASRTLIISVDESRNHTHNIQTRQRIARTLQAHEKDQNKTAVIRRHQVAQQLLDTELAIVNNYAPQLTFPTDRLKYRRGNDHYLDLIDVVAFLKQHQKPIQSSPHLPKYIEVSKDDIADANAIFIDIMGWSIDELSPTSRKLLQAIVTHCHESGNPLFTKREIRERLKWGNTHLYNHLKKLAELDYILSMTSSPGTLQQFKLMYDGNAETSEKMIIGLKNTEELTD